MEDMETDTGIMVMDTMDTGTMDTMTMGMATIIMVMDITMVTMDMEDIIIMDMDTISIWSIFMDNGSNKCIYQHQISNQLVGQEHGHKVVQLRISQ